jgi:uncharacterized membrane protein
MLIYLAAYGAALVSFVIADMVWLGTMVNRFYRPILQDVLIAGVNLPPAIVFYLLYPVGLIIFAIAPALKAGTITTAIFNGALFGFFTYATYDLSNYATLRNWNLPLTAVDVTWGTVLGAIAATVGYLVAQSTNSMS